jgi:hypothetical protein
MRVICVTSDRYLWTLKPFSYLFNCFWSELQEVTVIGYSFPNFSLPPNFIFRSVAPVDYPPEKWSNALIQVLNTIPDDQFVFLLDDYWLCRTVDHRGIMALGDYMHEHSQVFRMDLTCDVLHANGDARAATFYEYYGHYDIFEKTPDKEYRMSLQASIFNKDKLLAVLANDRTPWQTELYSEIPKDWLILGTHQWPVRYANAVHKGKVDKEELKLIPEPHRSAIDLFVPKEWEVKVPVA